MGWGGGEGSGDAEVENTGIGQARHSTVGPDFSNLFLKCELVRIIEEIESSGVKFQCLTGKGKLVYVRIIGSVEKLSFREIAILVYFNFDPRKCFVPLIFSNSITLNPSSPNSTVKTSIFLQQYHYIIKRKAYGR